MHLERLAKSQFPVDQALIHVEALLSNAWASGAKVYLISPGNHSKRDYEKLAKEYNSRLVAVRSIFGKWFRAISLIVPGSYIGALELSRSDKWGPTFISLANHGYVVLVGGDGDIEDAVIDIVETYSSNRLPKLCERLSSKFKVIVLNAETPNHVEIETNISKGSPN
jgi:hypothetical protein